MAIKLTKHPTSNMRNFNAIEATREAGEYFSNRTTKTKFPNLFTNPQQFVEVLSKARPTYLTAQQLAQLQNSDVGALLKSPDAKANAESLAQQYGKNLSSVMDGLAKGRIPYPVVISHAGGLYLLGGNTRLMGGIAVSKNVPVKLVNGTALMKLNAEAAKPATPDAPKRAGPPLRPQKK